MSQERERVEEKDEERKGKRRWKGREIGRERGKGKQGERCRERDRLAVLPPLSSGHWLKQGFE